MWPVRTLELVVNKVDSAYLNGPLAAWNTTITGTTNGAINVNLMTEGHLTVVSAR